MPISPLAGPSPLVPADPRLTPAKPAYGGDFAAVLREALTTVQSYQQTAEQKVDEFLSGESQDLHTAILATQRAELAFELFLQVRNKVVQAYQEVMRMPV